MRENERHLEMIDGLSSSRKYSSIRLLTMRDNERQWETMRDNEGLWGTMRDNERHWDMIEGQSPSRK